MRAAGSLRDALLGRGPVEPGRVPEEELARRRFLGAHRRVWQPVFVAAFPGAIPGVLAGAVLALRLRVPAQVDATGWLWVGSGMLAGGVAGWWVVWAGLRALSARGAACRRAERGG